MENLTETGTYGRKIYLYTDVLRSLCRVEILIKCVLPNISSTNCDA